VVKNGKMVKNGKKYGFPLQSNSIITNSPVLTVVLAFIVGIIMF
jgi:hypothetical protein